MMLTRRFSCLAMLLASSVTACGQSTRPSRPDSDDLRFTTEGALALEETVVAKVTDSSSLLYPDRMIQEGFQLDWSSALMGQAHLKNFWLFEDTVLVETTNHQIHSLDRHTGHYRWVIQLSSEIDFDPTFTESEISGIRMFYIIANNKLYAIDATRTVTGRELGVLRWKFHLPYTPSTPPHANEYFVALGVEEHNYVISTLVQSIDRKEKYIPNQPSWKRSLNGNLTATPASSGDREDATLMVATQEGTIFGLLFNSGDRLWEFPSTYKAGAFRAPLLIHGSQIFAANSDHTLYVLERSNGNLLGKCVLDSALVDVPWVVGDLAIVRQEDSDEILRLNNDMDIFVHSEPSTKFANGVFYHLRVGDIVVRNKTKVEVDETEQVTNVQRRWNLNIVWSLPGDFKYLFRTRDRFFLQDGNDIVAVRRTDGELVRRFNLGNTPVKVHFDPTSDYEENRLFLGTEDGGIFALKVK